jgi:hypothetical protein
VIDYKIRVLIEKAARDAGFAIATGIAGSNFRFRSRLTPGELAASSGARTRPSGLASSSLLRKACLRHLVDAGIP